MTNSSPDPSQSQPPPPRGTPRRAILSFDEMVAIIVAFGTIGAILFWFLGGRREGGIGRNLARVLSLLTETDETTATVESEAARAFRISATSENIPPVELEQRPRIRRVLRERDLSETNRLFDDQLAFSGSSINPAVLPSLTTATPPFVVDETERTPDSGIGTIATPQIPADSEGEIESEVEEAPSAETEVETPPVITETPETETPETETPETETPEAETPETETPETETPETETPEAETAETETPEAETPETETPETETPEAETPETKTTIVFRDVPEDYWAFPFIQSLANQGLVAESADNTFKPDQPVTRAQLAAQIDQSFKQDQSRDLINFEDISRDSDIANKINEAVKTGFLSGYPGQVFRPNKLVPRLQVLVALASGLGLQPSQDPEAILSYYQDADRIPDWAREQIAAATEAGLVVNPPDLDQTTLNPDEPATRAEVEAMIHQALVQAGRLEKIDSPYVINP